MNNNGIVTYRFKYDASDDANAYIYKCMKQYSCVYRYAYNRAQEGLKLNQIYHSVLDHMNNIECMDSYSITCAIKDAKSLAASIKSRNANGNIIFGGRHNFIRRCKGYITKEDFQKKRIVPLKLIGEANEHGNRRVRICQDLKTLTLRFNKNLHFNISIHGVKGERKHILSRLYLMQNAALIPITYYLDTDYISLIVDLSHVYSFKRNNIINNRIMAIDMNPNYIGWSVVDWKGEANYKVVDSGVFSIRDLNTLYYDNLSNSSDKIVARNTYVANKRRYELYQISKRLVNVCEHYRCELFASEQLDFQPGVKGRLINCCWNRQRFVWNLQKRCSARDINFLKVKSAYSSFIGNMIFRNLNLPDMILASIEIGRRAYEFNLQYEKKIKPNTKNIVFPNLKAYKTDYAKSLEEFGIEDGTGLVEAYILLKKSNHSYRLSLEQTATEFFRCFSRKSLIYQTL